jgi:hypothetical protein
MAKHSSAPVSGRGNASTRRPGSDPGANGARAAKAHTAASERSGTVAKEPLTIRLSRELLIALSQKQAEVRSEPGARRGDTTIGSVVETLLWRALESGSHRL